jgi:tRNA (guanine37-N1)-methyltransferase
MENSSSKIPHFFFVTLFPQAIEVWLTTSILGRAHQNGLFYFETVQLRDYATNKHRSVDDTPYGGGGGMVLRLEPLVAAVEAIKQRSPLAQVVHFSPKGARLDSELLESFSHSEAPRDFIFICGHYEGIDERFCTNWVDQEISLGDFVLTGGELPAVAFADALVRRIAGTLANEKAHQEESFSLVEEGTGRRLLEFPHYTRPPEFRGLKVPDVLLGGNHAAIARWRQEQSKRLTDERSIVPRPLDN